MAEENGGVARSGYALAAAILIVGTLIGAVLLGYVVYSIAGLSNDMERVTVPGTSEVSLEETGRYTVFYERRESITERGFDSDDPPDLVIEVRAAETGSSVPISGERVNITYSFWSSSGDAIASFRIDEPGTYEITAEYGDESVDEEAVLALGEGVGTTIVIATLVALGAGAFFCGTIGVALVIAIITLVSRSRVQSPPAQPENSS